MRKYKFIYRDKNKNELDVIVREEYNYKRAVALRDALLAECRWGDVKTILVRRIYE